MKANDILAYDMHIRRPPRPVGRAQIGETKPREIIGERIHPNIHHMGIITGHRNAPFQGCAADRNILQATFYKTHDLVVAAFRADKVGGVFIKFQQTLGVVGQAKFVVLLLHPFHWCCVR